MGKGIILLGIRRSSSQILIVDNGVGIPPAEQKNIFDEFYQLNNPERNRSKGLGLGLAIVQRTVSLLGHTIRLDSKLNHGCTFSIQLPIIKKSKRVIETPSSKQRPVFETGNSRNILIVEDDQEVLYALDALLKSWGHNTFLALNKRDAVHIGQINTIHIIVSDYQLQHDDNGIDVILALRDHYQSKLPAILLTGNTNPATLKAISHYRIPVLNKPCIPDELAAELERFI